MPKRNRSGRTRVRSNLRRGRPVNLRNERRLVLFKKPENTFSRRDKRTGQLRKRRITYDYEQCNAMLHDRGELIGFVADTAIMGNRNPSASTDITQPSFVRAIVREMVCMPFHR